MKIRQVGTFRFIPIFGGAVVATPDFVKWDTEFAPKLVELINEAWERGFKIELGYEGMGEEIECK